MSERFILASSSPQRRALLKQVNLQPAQIIAADVDETPIQGEMPRKLAIRLAYNKGVEVAARFPNDFILAADTVVACGRRILDKVDNADAASEHLRLLSGRRHQVYGGVAVVTPGGTFHTRLVTTQVTFKRLNSSEIKGYLESGEWKDKAGAYAIQGIAGAFVKRINGSCSNVVGLPLYETLALLRGSGFTGAQS